MVTYEYVLTLLAISLVFWSIGLIMYVRVKESNDKIRGFYDN